MKKLAVALFSAGLCLLLTTCCFLPVPEPDYPRQMIDAAVLGDFDAGYAAAEGWNARNAERETGEPPIDFGDLFLLAKFIYAQAGNRRYSREMRLCIGEVVLNRAASVEFPDSIREVIFEKGQYEFVDSEEFRLYLRPTRDCAEAALALLRGERMMAPQVVFQSREQIGKVHTAFCDRVMGFTYFCESPNPQLYQTAGVTAEQLPP